MKVGYAITGYPGAGKSEVGELLAETIDAINIETGNVVRREAAAHFDCDVENLSSDELGEYSTMRREQDGGDYVIQDVIEDLLDRDDFPERPVVITGVRDSEVPNLLRTWFDEFNFVWVAATFQTRLERLQDRGRQDEDGFTEEDLEERDLREADWGTADLEDEQDVNIINEGSMEQLEASVFRVAELTLPDEFRK